MDRTVSFESLPGPGTYTVDAETPNSPTEKWKVVSSQYRAQLVFQVAPTGQPVAVTLIQGPLADTSIQVKVSESTPRAALVVVKCQSQEPAYKSTDQWHPCGSQPVQDVSDKTLLDAYGLRNVTNLTIPTSLTFSNLKGGSDY
jgi:hypothetical protein